VGLKILAKGEALETAIGKIPNVKSQITNKFQITILNDQNAFGQRDV
jgi:hypothetical protein